MGQRTPTPALLDVRTRANWRAWLRTHHATELQVWLVFYKRHTGIDGIGYEEAVEEALCFGWVDSLVRRLDEDRFARKFTPRKPESKWSTSNRKRYASLAARGLLAAPGLERAPTGRSGDPPKVSAEALPAYIRERLKADPKAWDFYRSLAPSYRRSIIAWVDSAKREQTRERRLCEALGLLAAGRKLGLK